MTPDNTKPPLSFRKLPIAWSVLWGLACVLLIALWIYSYYYVYSAIRVVSSTTCASVQIQEGQLEVNWIDDPYEAEFVTRHNGPGWTGDVKSLEDYYWEMNQGDSAPPDGPHPFGSPILRGFAFQKDMGVVPIWFPVTLFVSCAVVPWMQWSKRFRLRTLLIATTLVAVVLGFVV